ncbi:type II secretion system F family protein [uncultured Roseobacter sp.]|uniref:type II secretion system F family protein n=1 Tax=uncultured Roseobacter sp. TaxID=114847 RepID=UPI002633A5E0|nr:type II secretion system F family protein [uncultured Roseobacter sp.]
MPGFRFVATTADGQRQEGNITATSQQAAIRSLRARGLLPLEVKAARRGVSLSLPARTSLKPSELAVLTRQLATLLGSGVRIEDALAAVGRQSGVRLSSLTADMRATILDGRSLAAALAKHPRAFDGFYIASVRAGETAGRLAAVLTHLAAHVETRSRNRNSVQLALIYPAILALVSVAVVIALLMFVVPDIVRVFARRGAELPGLTRALIALSDGLLVWWPWMLGLLSLMAGAVWQALRQTAARQRLHQALLRMPLVRQIAAVQFSGTLATLTQSGVALDDALAAAARTVSNLTYRGILSQVTTAVRDGTALSQAMARHRVFSPVMITMVASGEAGGSLPDALARHAEDTSHRLDATIKALVGLVEPLVLLVMGGIVMLLVLAILLPIVNLNTLVG